MSGTFQIACLKCKQRLKVRDEARGKVVACPRCETKLRVPQAEAARTPQLPPQSTAPTRLHPDAPQSTQPQQQKLASEPLSLPTANTVKTSTAAQSLPAKPLIKEAKPSTGTKPGRVIAGDDDEDLPVGKLIGSVMIPESPFSETDNFSTETPIEDDFFGIAIPPADTSAFVAPTPKGVASPAMVQAGSTPKALQQDLSKAIEKQLSGKIPKHRVGLGYRVGLSLNALFMMMLPLAYVGLVLGCVYGMYHYTFEVMPGLFSMMPRGRAAIIAVALYLTPPIAGCTVILFMIKPIFIAVMEREDQRSRSLNRANEPLLFELVDHICEVTGAPKPSRIDVDSEVNASASYGRGLRSLFSNDLVLTIGVPLAAGLNTRQFAGVLAHEFGHFSQGAGMRASYLIRSINGWFARVVYQRDGIDEALDEAIEESESVFGLVLLIAKVCVYLVRGVMWVFMMLAHIGSCFLLRQMEFDADRYEAHVSGSETFASTSQSMRLLGHAQYISMIGLGKLINKAVLIDDLPRMIQMMSLKMPHTDRTKILATVNEEKTGIFDSHPSDAARIAAAARLAVDGMWTVDRPARELFRHYDGLCRNVTQDFYRNQIGRMIDPTEMQPIEQHLHVLTS